MHVIQVKLLDVVNILQKKELGQIHSAIVCYLLLSWMLKYNKLFELNLQ